MHCRTLLTAIFALCVGRCAMADGGPITLYFDDRPPLLYRNVEGQVTGAVGDLTQRIFLKAGIEARWVLAPTERILGLIKRDSEPACIAGWYRTPERERYARFTLPIYADKTVLGLVSAHSPFQSGIAAGVLLAAPRIRVAIMQGLYYGPDLTPLIEAVPHERVAVTTSDYTISIRMVHDGRADIMFVTEDEAEDVVKLAGYEMKDFRLLTFPDVHGPLASAILCSQKVAPAIIDRLDKAITSLGLPLRK
jgi:hypothetical protein